MKPKTLCIQNRVRSDTGAPAPKPAPAKVQAAKAHPTSPPPLTPDDVQEIYRRCQAAVENASSKAERKTWEERAELAWRLIQLDQEREARAAALALGTMKTEPILG